MRAPRPQPALAALLLVAQAASPLSYEALRNFSFDLGATSSVEDGTVPLQNGTWTDPEGGSTFTLHPVHAVGDFDADRVADAVAIVVEATGGTGSFSYMFAVKGGSAGPQQLGEPEWLGDRSVIERVTIDRKGIIAVRYLTHKDSDPSCCPTLKIEDRYRIENGRLVGITR